MITENLKNVKDKIKKTCETNNIDSEKVRLICVSKTKPENEIMECYDFGERDFGENKVQDMVDKYEHLPKDIKWHFIGHLQRNKVKYLVGKAYLIHSVDSRRLLEQIEKDYKKEGLTANVLLEINVAEEESKFGYTTKSVMDDLEYISTLENVKVKGLMTVAPYTENPNENAKYFKKLRELSVDIMDKKYDNISMEFLSMGMTGDYEVAIKEGATHVRVGTGIFGERNYK